MIGQIERYASDTPTIGVIKSGEELYDFNVKVWRSRFAPMVGDNVEFEVKDGKVTRAKPFVTYAENMQPVKSRLIAGLLGLVLGGIGAHRVYLGFYGTAVLQIALTVVTGGFGLLWGFIEGALILGTQIDKDAQGRALK
ncbi:MAG: TM2 domain-containing protein [Methylococcaceae bacterium]|nr:TM2 domain-containing protein [Methylococcaceae bacterium]